MIEHLIDIITNLDKYLDAIIQSYGMLTYAILFLIVFCETAFVIVPFLPGDSLLFAAGALAARGSLHVLWLFGLLAFAAIIGDTVNYQIGHFLGSAFLEKRNLRFIKKEHVEKTQEFCEKHGGFTIFIARFIPLFRRFAPFMAGIGKMPYGRFVFFNIFGGVCWTGVFILAGYYFGNLAMIKDNLSWVICAIIVASVVPGIYKYLRKRFQKVNLEQSK